MRSERQAGARPHQSLQARIKSLVLTPKAIKDTEGIRAGKLHDLIYIKNKTIVDAAKRGDYMKEGGRKSRIS